MSTPSAKDQWTTATAVASVVVAEEVVALAVADLAVVEATLLAAARSSPEVLLGDVAAAAPVRRPWHRQPGSTAILESRTVLVLFRRHGVKWNESGMGIWSLLDNHDHDTHILLRAGSLCACTIK
jgi:hypothetical protein